MTTSLKETDPELYGMLCHEYQRQKNGLELIASENFTSRAVMEALGSCLTNKYSEGLPGERYYGGNEYIDQIERLCQKRALAAFRLDAAKWGVNVQPYSGSPANFAVYTALLEPGERVMGLHLPHGGHLTHGFATEKDGQVKSISATSRYFQSKPYFVNVETQRIDYDKLAADALEFKPKLLICGYSGHSRDLDYARFRQIADSVGAMLLCDMAHFSGLVASEEMANPFEFCDVVTSTTHKTLRGPRAGMIFYRKELESRINFAVFPALQGGPHNHQIAALAVQLAEVATPEFRQYARQIKANAQALAKTLLEGGEIILTGGTENHMVMWDLRPHDITGSKFEAACDMAHMTLNKNSLPGDVNAIQPGGVRVGSPALTTRGLKEEHFVFVGKLLLEVLAVCKDVQAQSGKKLADFKEALRSNAQLKDIGRRVQEFIAPFPLPGIAPE